MAKPRRSYTPPQLAAEWGCKPSTVHVMIKDGRIKAFQVGVGTKRPRLRIPRSEVERLERSYEPETNDKPKRRRTPKPADPDFIWYY